MANPDRNRKLLVRSAFATGSTLAILVGAQSLALSDARQFAATPTEDADDIAVIVSPAAPEESSVKENVQVIQSAPSITVLRQASNPNVSSSNGSLSGQNLVVQPPVASLASTPEPVIVQSQSQQQSVITVQSAPSNQSNRQHTRSSR